MRGGERREGDRSPARRRGTERGQRADLVGQGAISTDHPRPLDQWREMAGEVAFERDASVSIKRFDELAALLPAQAAEQYLVGGDGG